MTIFNTISFGIGFIILATYILVISIATYRYNQSRMPKALRKGFEIEPKVSLRIDDGVVIELPASQVYKYIRVHQGSKIEIGVSND